MVNPDQSIDSLKSDNMHPHSSWQCCSVCLAALTPTSRRALDLLLAGMGGVMYRPRSIVRTWPVQSEAVSSTDLRVASKHEGLSEDSDQRTK